MENNDHIRYREMETALKQHSAETSGAQTAALKRSRQNGGAQMSRTVTFYRPRLSITCNLVCLFIHSFISIVISDSSF